MDAKDYIGPAYRLHPIFVGVLAVVIVLAILVAFSVVNVGGNQVGIVEKKLGGGKLPEGRILAVNGENGIQAQILSPGWHFFYWPWQYKITKEPLTEITEGFVGLIQASDGRSLPPDTIYAPEWDQPDKMLEAAYFLSEGKGYKGPQLTVLKPGKYRLNTRLFSVTTVPVTNVKVGSVAVIKSNVGPRAESQDRLVETDQRGIWRKPLNEGEYYLNTKAYEVTMIDTRQVKVSYTAVADKGERGEALKPITVRSKDGFTFPVDVRVSYRIDRENAPRVAATVGDDELVLNKLVTPAVRAIFRNNAEKVKALDYVQERSKQEEKSAQMLQDELEKYGVTVLAVRIGDIGDEKTLGQLLKTQTDREIALQQQTTLEVQQQAAEKQKALAKAEQEAEEERRLATAAYSVQIAEEEKKQRIIEAQAEAEQITLVADAKAKAYRLVSDVIGPDNAALLELMKLVADRNIKITPDVMVGGGGAGMSDALMGTILRGKLMTESKPPPGTTK